MVNHRSDDSGMSHSLSVSLNKSGSHHMINLPIKRNMKIMQYTYRVYRWAPITGRIIPIRRPSVVLNSHTHTHTACGWDE